MTIPDLQALTSSPAKSILAKLEELEELLCFSNDKNLDNNACKYSVDSFCHSHAGQLPSFNELRAIDMCH